MAVQQYNIVELGSLYGRKTVALDINNAGQVVGYSEYWEDNFPRRPFLWQNGQMTELQIPAGLQYSGMAYGINDAGVVAGYSSALGGATVWQNGSATGLSSPYGLASGATAINNGGQVAGWVRYGTGSYDFNVAVWQNGTMTEIARVGTDRNRVLDISDSGQIVGYAGHAFLWDNGVMTNLGASYAGSTAAFAVNASGQIVGQTEYSSLSPDRWWYGQPLLWSGGVMTYLPVPTNGHGTAKDINDLGEIVGAASGSGAYGAAYWKDGQMYDLNDLAIMPLGTNWVLEQAVGINNLGQIIANDEFGHAFLLTPTPEPATLLLLALGSLLLARRRLA
jgi:probable HAF family extracellular repeat protein